MSDSCNNDRAPFTTMLSFKELICDEWVFWVLVVVALGIQIGRNQVWIWSSQASREALNTRIDSPERSKLVLKLLAYTLLSFVLYIINFLLIVGGNVYFMLALLAGNLVGTWWGMRKQTPDKHKIDSTGELEALLQLLSKQDSALNAIERNDLAKFKKRMIKFLDLEKPVQAIVGVNNYNYKNFKY